MDDGAGVLEHSAVGGKEAGTLNKNICMCGGGGDLLGEEVREGIPRGQGKRAWDLDPCRKNRDVKREENKLPCRSHEVVVELAAKHGRLISIHGTPHGRRGEMTPTIVL